MTIGAEFKGHIVPTLEGNPLTTQEYVVVEVGLFGPAGSKTNLSVTDFALRVDWQKTPLPCQPYGMVTASLKDPEWIPPEQEKDKSSAASEDEDRYSAQKKPEEVKIPLELVRTMAQRVQKVALPLGERQLPQAGIIFFRYRGNTSKIESLELIYNGPSGPASLKLQP
jgi:hypothetical protein